MLRVRAPRHACRTLKRVLPCRYRPPAVRRYVSLWLVSQKVHGYSRRSMDDFMRPRAIILRHVAPWTVLFVGVLAALSALKMPLSRDAGGFLSFGERIAQGAVFYRDLFERKTPLLFYELGWLFRVVEPSLLWGRLLVLAHTAVAAIILWAISRRCGWSVPWRIGLVGAFLVLVPVFVGFEPLTEIPVMLFGTLAVGMALCEIPSRRVVRSLLIGLLIGVATASKQVGIALAPAVGLWLVIDDHHRRHSVHSTLGSLIAMSVGVAVPLCVMAAYFRAVGSLDAMVYAVWTSNLFHYPGFPLRQWLYELARNEVARAFVIWLPAAIAAPFVVWRFVRSGEARVEALLVLVVVFSWLPSLKRPYEHYVLTFLPHLALLGTAIWRQWIARYRLTLLVPLAAVALFPTVRHYVLYVVPPVADGVLARQIAAADRIRSYLEPGEPLYLLGAEPKYYFLSGHYPDDPVYFIMPENAHMRPPEMVREILTSTPGLRYVVVVEPGVLEPVRDVADEVRARSHEVFCEQIGRTERVCLYRLPEDWAVKPVMGDGG